MVKNSDGSVGIGESGNMQDKVWDLKDNYHIFMIRNTFGTTYYAAKKLY